MWKKQVFQRIRVPKDPCSWPWQSLAECSAFATERVAAVSRKMGLSGNTIRSWAGRAGGVHLEGRRIQDNPEPLAEPKGAPRELERDLEQWMEGQDTGNGFPLPEGRVTWDIGREFSPGRVGRCWHRVPRAAVAAPGSLAVSKARLDRDWSTLGMVEGVPVHGRGGTGWALRSLP